MCSLDYCDLKRKQGRKQAKRFFPSTPVLYAVHTRFLFCAPPGGALVVSQHRLSGHTTLLLYDHLPPDVLNSLNHVSPRSPLPHGMYLIGV